MATTTEILGNEAMQQGQLLVRFAMTQDPSFSPLTCSKIVEFLAGEFGRDDAEWKNAMMFHLTGSQALT